MPRRPSPPISRSRSVGHRASSQASGARAGDLLAGEVAAQLDQFAFGSGELEVHRPILLDRPVQQRTGAVRSGMASDRSPAAARSRRSTTRRRRSAPTASSDWPPPSGSSGTSASTRARPGTSRRATRSGPTTSGSTRSGMNFKQIRVRDLLLVNDRGRGRRGDLAGEPGGLRDPLADPRRPAPTSCPPPTPTRCTARRGRSLRRPLDPLTQDACAFYGDHVVFDDYTGAVLDLEEGKRIAQVPGRHQGGHPGQPRPAHRRARPSTRRRGGSSPWSAPARRSWWPRRPAPPSSSTRTWPGRPPARPVGHRTGWRQFQPLYDWIVAAASRTARRVDRRRRHGHAGAPSGLQVGHEGGGPGHEVAGYGVAGLVVDGWPSARPRPRWSVLVRRGRSPRWRR